MSSIKYFKAASLFMHSLKPNQLNKPSSTKITSSSWLQLELADLQMRYKIYLQQKIHKCLFSLHRNKLIKIVSFYTLVSFFSFIMDWKNFPDFFIVLVKSELSKSTCTRPNLLLEQKKRIKVIE